MKICAFSDIHGNSFAFNEAVAAIRDEGADANIFLGDLCGYYYDQVEILEGFGTIPNLICIKGNHDEMFLRIASGDEALRSQYLEKYGHCMENLLSQNATGLCAWLRNLDFLCRDNEHGFACFHGGPLDAENEYVYPDTRLQGFDRVDKSLVLLGHTHYRMNRTFGNVQIVNPGSLGQPRDGRAASYAVIDSDIGSVLFRDVPFDKEALKMRVQQMGDQDTYLDGVLSR